MTDKLKSRKLWITVAVAMAILLVQVFEIPVDIEAIMVLAGLGASYNVAQGWVDASGAQAGTTLAILQPSDDDGDGVLH